MRQRSYRWWLVVSWLVLLSACASWQWNEPKVSIGSIEALSRKGWNQTLLVTLRVENPNDKPLPIKGLTLSLQVHGKDLATGVSQGGVTIAPFAISELPVELNVNLLHGAGVLFTLWRKRDEQVAYRITGDVYVGENLSLKLPFEHQGRIAIDD